MKQKLTFFFFLSIFLTSCGNKNKEDLINNYEKYTAEILDLREYYNELVPEGFLVSIRYESSRKFNLFVYQPSEKTEKRELLFQKWDINFKTYVSEENRTEYDIEYNGITNSLDLVKDKLKWTNETFTELYKRLDNVNCIGITNGNPTEIEYGFKGMGVYSYLIFDNNLTPELQAKYTDKCTMMFYKNKVVLEYGSGAIGSLCTPEFKNEK